MYVRKRARAARFGKMHRRRKFAAAGMLAIAACGLAVSTSPETIANAQEGVVASITADSDGNVPVQSVCFGASQGAATDQYVAEQQYTVEPQYAVEQPFVAEQQYAVDQYAGDLVGGFAAEQQYGAGQYTGVQYATGQYGGENLGLYSWYNDGFATYGTISIDDCALNAMGAGPLDRERVIAHEQGHANGALHSDDPNDVMYPIVPVTGS